MIQANKSEQRRVGLGKISALGTSLQFELCSIYSIDMRFELKDSKRWRIHYHPTYVVSVLITLTLYFWPDLLSFSPQTLHLIISSYVKEQRLIWLTAIPSSCSCAWTGAQPPLHFNCSQQRTASGPQINSTAVFWTLSILFSLLSKVWTRHMIPAADSSMTCGDSTTYMFLN